jgi:autotransporter translocation and assembly factor TamB
MKLFHRGPQARRLLPAFGIVAAVTIGLIAFCAILPGLPPFKSFVLSIVNKKASSVLFCTATVGAVSIDLRKGIVAKEVVLSDSFHWRSPLTVESVAARINLHALLQGRFELRSIKITGLHGELLNTHKGLFAGPADIGRISASLSQNPGTTGGARSKSLVQVITAERCTVSYVDSITKISTAEAVQSVRLEFVRADSISFVLHAGAGMFTSPVWSGSVQSNDVQGAVGPASLLFNSGKVQGDSAVVSFHGTIPFSMEKAWDLTANVEAFVAGFPVLHKNFPALKSVGKVRAQGAMTGSIVHPVLSVTCTGSGLRAGSESGDSLFLQANYSNDLLRGKARFWSRYRTADAGFYAAGTGLRRVPDTMSIDIRELAGHDTAGTVNAALRLARNKWDLTAEMKPDIELRGTGRYNSRGAIDGSLHVQVDSMTHIASMFSIDSVHGSLAADALLSGTIGNPAVSATINIGRLSYGSKMPLADTVSADCRYAGQNLALQSLVVKRGKSVMQSSGSVSWTGGSRSMNADAKFTLDYAVPSGLVLTTTGDLAFSNGIATATMKTVQKGSGIPLSITAHIPVAMNELSKGLAAVRDGAVVAMSGDLVSYGGLLNAFVPSVQSHGTFDLHGALSKAHGEWELSCSTHIVNHELTDKRERIKAGHAVLDVRITGPLARPAAGFTVSGDSIDYYGNLITGYWGKGSITSEALTLDTLHFSVKGGRADLSALVPVSLKNGFSFNENGRVSATVISIPLSILQPLVSDAVTINKGELSGRVVAVGTAKGVPLAEGSLSLRNGELYIYNCDKPLGPLSADIAIKNDSITLRLLQAAWGKGRISGSGWAVFGAQGVSAAKSTIKLNDVRLGGCYENLDLGIQTADIILTKDSLVTILVNAVLSDTRFTQDYSLIDLGEQIKKRAQQPPRPPNPLFKKVVMRVAVNCNSNLTFDSNLGKMLVDGSVTVAGRPDKPGIVGQFQIINGFVYYLDRKFTVTQGSIRQYDPKKIDPSLDVTATSTVSWYPPQGGKSDYDISLLVKGYLSNPVITLSAVPSLPQPQIISLLTLGTIQTGMGTDLGSRTGSLVSQQLAGFGTRKLARFLNVESVDIYGNAFGPSSAGPQVSVTKQVTSRVAVTYSKGLSRLSQQMVQVSYRILSFLYLEAESDQQAQGGADLKFRYSR